MNFFKSTCICLWGDIQEEKKVQKFRKLLTTPPTCPQVQHFLHSFLKIETDHSLLRETNFTTCPITKFYNIFSPCFYPKLGPIARFLGCFTIVDMHTAQGTPDQVLNINIEPYNNSNDSTILHGSCKTPFSEDQHLGNSEKRRIWPKTKMSSWTPILRHTHTPTPPQVQ